MALDAICVRALAVQLKKDLEDAKADKIHQPEKDEITIYFRSRTKSIKLLISASPANPRVHFLNTSKTNPMVAPNFCMLLRKHLAGARVKDVCQRDFERIIDITFSCITEMGDSTEKHLICEIMGRHSNIILTDESFKILDSIKRIDLLTSSVRQILPGLNYKPVPPQGKINPLTAEDDEIIKAVLFAEEDIEIPKFIMSHFEGFSPVNARELCFDASLSLEKKINELSSFEKEALIGSIKRWFLKIKNCDFKPCVISDKTRPVDFSCFEIKQYGAAAEASLYEDISSCIEDFYYTRDSAERKKQKSAGLLKVVTNNIERCAKKINLLNKTLEDAKDRDRHKMYADLISANLYRIEQGAKYVEVENFYSPDLEKIRISLDASISPQANAQRYYKKYTKAKVAAIEAKKQLEIAQSDLSYLESVLGSIDFAETEQDLAALKEELAAGGYISKEKKDKRKKGVEKISPMHFVSSEGFSIYVGKNNLQNDFLTLRMANSSDLWFHTKNSPGSHVVIKFGIKKDVTDLLIFEAATLAATYSSVKNSSKVAVDYTQVKNVKKPNGARPGMVIYDNYNTIYVDPDENLAKKLIKK